LQDSFEEKKRGDWEKRKKPRKGNLFSGLTGFVYSFEGPWKEK
jgi:hypothetical protein